MPNRAIVFVSEARAELSEAHLTAIMADAARFNWDAGVSGVTLFDGRRFLAYMEGPPDGLDVAFSRALSASSHAHLVEVARGRVGQRRVPYWPMRLVDVETAVIPRLLRADWSGFVQRADGGLPPVTAMDLLASMVLPIAEVA
ncbi:BLUF domain-containing protein [Stenotrophomonas maltophilia]|uniref:BLUF domain-containing protein n=1 Tax=Stenotrophomonas maltophilia TaxID=40324 RepID=UPI0010766061|nr:BLUF domain-containing protein [Stenotrophomonas maltophilia]TFZ46137.1 BLUF domain-containing protein [Stenotrophomonas maltophilia]